MIGYLRKWISPDNAPNEEGLLRRAPIVRTDAQNASYQEWKASPGKESLTRWLYGEYQVYSSKERKTDPALSFLCCVTTKGFAWYYDPKRWSKEEFQNMYDLFRDRTIALGYREHVSEEKVFQKSSGSETFQRRYLKANNENSQDLYGDILICFLEQNDQVVSIKFSAAACGNPVCTCDSRFGQLMQKLLE